MKSKHIGVIQILFQQYPKIFLGRMNIRNYYVGEKREPATNIDILSEWDATVCLKSLCAESAFIEYENFTKIVLLEYIVCLQILAPVKNVQIIRHKLYIFFSFNWNFRLFFKRENIVTALNCKLNENGFSFVIKRCTLFQF